MIAEGSSGYGRQGTGHTAAFQDSAMRVGHGTRAAAGVEAGHGNGGSRLGRVGGNNEMKMNGSPPSPFYKSVGQLKSPEAQKPR